MFKPAETRVKGVKAKKKHQSIRTERIGMQKEKKMKAGKQKTSRN